jgi:CBS domain-containing protein
MKVKDVMTTDVAACRPESNLAEAGALMFHRDCGCLPVVDADGHVVGILTDRDIAIAAANKERPANRINVREAATETVFSCGAEDEIAKALGTMQTRRVRRLPVIDDSGHLKGLLSLDDVVQKVGTAGAPSATEVLTALQGICGRDPLVVASGA